MKTKLAVRSASKTYGFVWWDNSAWVAETVDGVYLATVKDKTAAWAIVLSESLV